MKPDLAMKAVSRLGQVDVREDFIESANKKFVVHGLWEHPDTTGTGRPRITVNPAHHVVDTLIHEAIHDLHPEKSERAVLMATKKVMKKMTPAQVWAVYVEYRRRVAPKAGDE